MPHDRADDAWPADFIAATEPVANAMAAELLGDPDDYRITATVVGADGAMIPGELPRVVKLSELGLSPLALVRSTASSKGGGPSSLELKFVRHLSRAAPLPEGAGLQIDRKASGLSALLARLRSLRAVLFDRPALSARALAPPVGRLPIMRIPVSSTLERPIFRNG